MTDGGASSWNVIFLTPKSTLKSNYLEYALSQLPLLLQALLKQTELGIFMPVLDSSWSHHFSS